MANKKPLVIEGYASVFSVRDLAGDIVEAGAFANTLASRRAPEIKMLASHNPSLSIGEWVEIVEDSVGLWVKGVINPLDKLTESMIKNVCNSTIRGLSIGFRTTNSTPNMDMGKRILSLDLIEVSLVRCPMLPAAQIRRASFDDCLN